MPATKASHLLKPPRKIINEKQILSVSRENNIKLPLAGPLSLVGREKHDNRIVKQQQKRVQFIFVPSREQIK